MNLNIKQMIKASNIALDKVVLATKEERISTKRRYNNKAIYNYIEVPEQCFKSSTKKKVIKQYDPIVHDLLGVNKEVKQLSHKPTYIQRYIKEGVIY